MKRRNYYIFVLILAAAVVSAYAVNSIMLRKSAVSSGRAQTAAAKESPDMMQVGTSQSISDFSVKTSEFVTGNIIPVKYVCQDIDGGDNVSIPLKWENAPSEAKSFAVFMYDKSPVAHKFVHWAVINIPNNVREILEGASRTPYMPASSVELKNSAGSIGYTGPCPPLGTGKHEYIITVYALNAGTLHLSGLVSLSQFLAAIDGKVIAKAEMSGYFER